MPTSFDTNGNYEATNVSSVQNPDGSYTYKATIKGLPVTWGSTSCVATVEVTIEAPSGTPVPSAGNMFRFAGNGGYNVKISGTDFP